METTVQLEAFGSALPRVSKFPSQSLNILGLSLKAQDLTRLNPDIIGEIREIHPLLTTKLNNITLRHAVKDYLSSYNQAVKDEGLDGEKNMNPVDANGQPIPKPGY